MPNEQVEEREYHAYVLFLKCAECGSDMGTEIRAGFIYCLNQGMCPTKGMRFWIPNVKLELREDEEGT